MDLWAFVFDSSVHPFNTIRLLLPTGSTSVLSHSSSWLHLGLQDLLCCLVSSALPGFPLPSSPLVLPTKSPPWLLPTSTLPWNYVLGFLLWVPHWILLPLTPPWLLPLSSPPWLFLLSVPSRLLWSTLVPALRPPPMPPPNLIILFHNFNILPLIVSLNKSLKISSFVITTEVPESPSNIVLTMGCLQVRTTALKECFIQRMKNISLNLMLFQIQDNF